jgi:hypothetical protein
MSRSRLALAALLAAAAISPAAAQAHDRPTEEERCARKLERIETRFRVIEEKRGYEAATEWWQDAWARYYERCEKP